MDSTLQDIEEATVEANADVVRLGIQQNHGLIVPPNKPATP